MMNKKLLIPAVAILSLSAFCGCSGNGGGQTIPDMSHLPDYVAGISISVYKNDSVAFASMVQYPLSRPYPLHDIADSAQMVAYYPIMVDDSLRTMATNAETGWSQYGWRGWALDDGEVWVDEAGIYDIPYMSEAEKKIYEDLVEKEMATLTPDMRRGYIPVGCYKAADAKTVYRIDKRTGTDTFRLAVYDTGARRDAVPDRVLYGRRNIEGSAANISYEFTDGPAEAVLSPYPMSLDEMPSLSLSDGKTSSEIAIVPVYWLDILRQK